MLTGGFIQHLVESRLSWVHYHTSDNSLNAAHFGEYSGRANVETDVDIRRRIRADTHHEKTTGESSTDKQQCDKCARWFVNLSSHRKCSGRARSASYTNVPDASQPSRKTSHSGTATKIALKEKALLPKNNILQVSDVLSPCQLLYRLVRKIYSWKRCIQLGSPKENFLFNEWINHSSHDLDGWNDMPTVPTHSTCD